MAMNEHEASRGLLTRREMLALGAGTVGVMMVQSAHADVQSVASGSGSKLKRAPLTVHTHRIAVGATKPFTALHVTDSHLTLCNSRENDPRKVTLAMGRSTPWPSNYHYLKEAIFRARTKGEMILHTGDFIDFVSIANLEEAGRLFSEDDWFVSSGNHEYSLYVGEAREDEAYKHRSYARVQAQYPNDLTLASHVTNGVNFVSFDCTYHYVPEAVPELFAKEVAKGLPIVALCHNPLYSPEMWQVEGARCGRWMAGVPREVSEKSCHDARTVDFVRYLRSEKLVRAVVTGHIHRHVVAPFSPTATQYVGGLGAAGVVSELEFC